MMRASLATRSQRGFTFIELSFVIIVVGIIVSLIAQMVPAMRRSSSTAATVRAVTDTEFALESFAAIHARLPCADTDDDGLENTTPTCAVIGKLPFATLGLGGPLVNADGYDFKYSFYDHLGTLRTDAELGVTKERYRPSIGEAIPAGTPVALYDKAFSISNRRLDFCQAMRASLDGAYSDSYLHVQTPSGNKKNVAYVLVDPGVANLDLVNDLFDGLNGAATAALPRFDHPNRQQSVIYDDRVTVGYFDLLSEAMGCSPNMATAGRAQPNVETTMALMKQTMTDYRTQMDIAVDMAYADNFSAGAGLAAATNGTLSSTGALLIEIASAINLAGATAAASVSGAIAIGLNAAALVLAIANLALTVQNYNDFKASRTTFDNLIANQFDPLYQSIKNGVQTSGETVYSDE
jgi:prepilin-type N-terminal cleavage/methylation domain-containing protein